MRSARTSYLIEGALTLTNIELTRRLLASAPFAMMLLLRTFAARVWLEFVLASGILSPPAALAWWVTAIEAMILAIGDRVVRDGMYWPDILALLQATCTSRILTLVASPPLLPSRLGLPLLDGHRTANRDVLLFLTVHTLVHYILRHLLSFHHAASTLFEWHLPGTPVCQHRIYEMVLGQF